MFSKEEARKLKKSFWTKFGVFSKLKREKNELNPHWLLYNTKIKDFSLKFEYEGKTMRVCLDIEMSDDDKRLLYFIQLQNLNKILTDLTKGEVIYNENFILNNGKEISRIYIEKKGKSINDASGWGEAFEFLYNNMIIMENFFIEYEDYIKAAV